MWAHLNQLSEPVCSDTQLVRQVVQALKDKGVEGLEAVDVSKADLDSLFANGGRLARLKIRAIGDENEKMKLPEDLEPLRFVWEDAGLDAVPKGKVVAVTGSIQDRSGRLGALIFSKGESGLTFEENRFLATA
jgi:hypothetical protein